MTNDQMQQKLIEVFQSYIEYSDQSFSFNYGDLNINDVHAIHFIGVLDKANVTAIAQQMKVTKGAVTKITKRLLKSSYISDYKLESNKKERYFKLTELGQSLFTKHQKIHKDNFDLDKMIFEHFEESGREVIYSFLETLQSHIEDKHSKQLQSEGQDTISSS